MPNNKQPIRTVSDLTLERIFNHYISKHPCLQYLSKPYRNNTHTLVTDSFQLLYISNQIIGESNITESVNLCEKEIEKLSRLEQNFFTRSSFNPTTNLSLDELSIKQLIKSIKSQQSELSTKKTITAMTYSSTHRELEVFTVSDSMECSSNVCAPCNTIGDSTSFTITLDTLYLLNSLMTHSELYGLSDSLLSIQHDQSSPYQIRLVNDAVAIVNIQTKKYDN